MDATTAMQDSARLFERQFLAEMLRSSGIGRTPSSFGGGVGEAQFSSFLNDQYAEAIMSAGGLGLSDQIMRSLIDVRGENE